MGKSVWILNHYAITPDLPGGTRHFSLARQLAKKGNDITIFASGFDHIARKFLKVNCKERKRIEEYDGVTFVWINTVPYSGNNWRRVLNMLSYSWRVLHHVKGLKKPDAVIGSSMHPFAVVAGWLLACRHRAKFIFEVRDLWPQTAVDMGVMKEKGFPARLLYAWERFFYKQAEKVIVLLPYAKEYIVNLGIDERKVIWLPNGVDLEKFDNPIPLDPYSDATKLFRQYQRKFMVLYTGAHGPANGLEALVSAASILQDISEDFHIILFGDGPEKDKLQRMARELSLSNISFLPPVSKEQIPCVLAKSDLLVHTLKRLDVFRHGISPNKIYDYFASKKPVVMATEAKNKIVLEAEAGITCEPGNPQALASAIVEIYRLPKEERARMGLNGRLYVERFHDIKILAKRLEELLI